MKKARPTIDEIRSKLTTPQKELLEEVWQHFRDNRDWLTVRKLFSEHGKQKVKEALSSLGGNVGREESSSTRWSKFQLSLLGVLLTKNGVAFQDLLERYFQFQRDSFKNEPQKDFFNATEVAAALGLKAEEKVLLGQLLHVPSASGSPNGDWGAQAMDEAENFPESGDLFEQVEDWVLRYYNAGARVFMEDERMALRPSPFPNLALSDIHTMGSHVSSATEPHPPEIVASLDRLRRQYPDPKQLGFLIMRFGSAKPLKRIVNIIKSTAEKQSLVVIRADEVTFHDDLFGNVRTLLHGCGFGIAIYERIDKEEPNANVGLEVGYLMAMNKPVLLLKDKNLRTLPSDLAGRLCKEFDPYDPVKTIPDQLVGWLKDYGFVIPKRA